MEDRLSVGKEKDGEITAEQKELLWNRIEQLKLSNAALKAENDMFERFLDAQDLSVLGAARASVRPRQLTLEEKLYVAKKEIRQTQQAQQELKQRQERMQDNYMASLKEAEISLKELNIAKKRFEHKLLKPMEEGRLDAKMVEKELQYNQDKLKRKVENFTLQEQMLKVQKKKFQQQLQQKKEMGPAEYETFQEYREQRIDKYPDELKVKYLKVQRNLNVHKEKLQSVTWESDKLSNDIASRKQLLAKIEEKIQCVEKERLKEEALNQYLRHQMTDYQAPGVMEYIHVKNKHKKLQQSVHTWERKVATAEISLKTHTKPRDREQATFTPANSAAAGAISAEQQMPVKLPRIL